MGQYFHIENLRLQVGDRNLFFINKLSFDKGDRVRITGESGVGKSQLLKGLCLKRSLSFDRFHISGRDAHEQRPMDFFYLFKNQNFGPGCLKWHINEITGFKTHRKKNVDVQMIMLELQKFFPNLSSETEYAGLSSGQKEVFHLVLALSLSPKVLGLDECLHSIDKLLRAKVQKYLIERYRGLIIFVHHGDNESFLNPTKVLNLRDLSLEKKSLESEEYGSSGHVENYDRPFDSQSL